MIIHDASSASKKHLQNSIQPIMQLSVFFSSSRCCIFVHTHINCAAARSTQCNLFMVAATIKLIPRDAFSASAFSRIKAVCQSLRVIISSNAQLLFVHSKRQQHERLKRHRDLHHTSRQRLGAGWPSNQKIIKPGQMVT